jgi:hypothetical protein
MVRHIVLWWLKSPAGADFTSIRAADFALVCDFADGEALAAYHRHPAAHQTPTSMRSAKA